MDKFIIKYKDLFSINKIIQYKLLFNPILKS